LLDRKLAGKSVSARWEAGRLGATPGRPGATPHAPLARRPRARARRGRDARPVAPRSVARAPPGWRAT